MAQGKEIRDEVFGVGCGNYFIALLRSIGPRQGKSLVGSLALDLADKEKITEAGHERPLADGGGMVEVDEVPLGIGTTHTDVREILPKAA